MDENVLDQETRNELALARSRVRRIVTYVAVTFIFLAGGYGIVWMGDRSVAMTVLTACIAWVSFWFGTRGKSVDTK